MMNTWFRNPAENAVVLLEVTGSLTAAQEIARLNALNAHLMNDDEFSYWGEVFYSLCPERGAQC